MRKILLILAIATLSLTACKKEQNPAPAETTAIEETKEETPTAIETETTIEKKTENVTLDLNKPYEEMTIEELQEAILEKMRKNGPVTDYMLGTVRENVYRDSLINWVKSFN